ncbi:MAG: hypothetical protein GY850_06480 [bacterium]|nr:hypothetical protein [bacterium]
MTKDLTDQDIVDRWVFLKSQAIFLLGVEVEQRLELITQLETEIRALTGRNQAFEGRA